MLPIVDAIDEPLLRSRAWKAYGRHQYFRATIQGEPVLLHRLIVGAKAGQIVDHINGDKLDCRRSNLRICDWSESNANRRGRKDSKSPYKGITQTPNRKWLAQIMKEKKFFRIGLFDNPEDAARAYDAAAVRLHGVFAKTNGFVTYDNTV